MKRLPLSVRLAAGALAPVTFREVQSILGTTEAETAEILARVPRLKIRGEVVMLGDVMAAAQQEQSAAAPVRTLRLDEADVEARAPRGRRSSSARATG